MTNAKLKKAIALHKYVVVTERSGATYAVNTQITLHGLRLYGWDLRKRSKVEAVQPCSFAEYISRKVSFTQSKPKKP